MKTKRSILCMLAVASAAVLFPAVAPAAETGELWETTVEMSMSGMTLPATKSKLCRATGEWSEPPGPPGDSKCEMTDVQRSGQAMSWRMRCTDPPATGTGTIEFQGDTYSGTMTLSMAEGEMVMNLSGKRAGACDLAAQQRDMEQIRNTAIAAQAQSAEMVEKMCAEGAAAGRSFFFIGPGAMCTAPAHKEAYCAGLLTETGYEGALAGGVMGVSPEDAIGFCGKDPEALRLEVCGSALAANSLVFADKYCPERRDEICQKALALEVFELLNERCPVQAQELAKRECAGRQYTALSGTKYGQFCVQYAQAEIAKEQQAAPDAEEEDSKEKTANKVKKGLKGLFGR